MIPGPNTTQNSIDEYLISIGRALSALDRLNKPRLELSLSGSDELRARKDEIEIELDELLENLPGIRILEEGNLSCEPEYFFQALCCATRKTALKQQDVMYKLKTETEKNLNADLFILKQDPIINQNLINIKERELTEFRKDP